MVDYLSGGMLDNGKTWAKAIYDTADLYKSQKVMLSTSTMNKIMKSATVAQLKFLEAHAMVYDNPPPEEESDAALWDQI